MLAVIMMKAYLDNAATTPVCPEAAAAALRLMTENFGNPSSTHGPGRDAREERKKARETLARSIGAQAEEIFFTSGGTEADNWAIRMGAHLMRHKGRHVISSAAEHDAVLKSLDSLEAQGFEITRLKPRADGAVHAEDLAAALRPDTVLVSLMMVNNETGAVTDIPAIANVLRKAASEALLHTDAVQAYGKLPFRVKDLGADLISLSGHKINAPKGIGALYVRKGLKLPPLMVGGGQENGLRSGTENLPGIAAFAAAAEASVRDSGAAERMENLRQRVLEQLRSAVPDMVVIGGGAPHLLCLSFPGYRSEVLLNVLDAGGISVSKGSACKRGARSHVLEAMGLPARLIDGAIRVSFCRLSREEEADYFCQELIKALKMLIKT